MLVLSFAKSLGKASPGGTIGYPMRPHIMLAFAEHFHHVFILGIHVYFLISRIGIANNLDTTNIHISIKIRLPQLFHHGIVAVSQSQAFKGKVVGHSRRDYRRNKHYQQKQHCTYSQLNIIHENHLT